ncbi:MAG: hypothetical protein AABX77_01270 [Nanoarchaeota archaeon]
MKRAYLVLFAILIAMPMILAIDISIKTLPDHRISVIIRNAGELTSLDSSHQNTGDGNVFVSSEVSADPIDLLVTLKKDNIKLMDKKFEGVSTAKLINLKFIPGEKPEIVESFEEKKNDTEVNSNNSVGNEGGVEGVETKIEETEQLEETKESVQEVVEETQTKPGITSKAIENVKDIVSSKTLYYIIGGILVIGVLFFVMRFARNRVDTGSFRVTKLSSLTSHTSHDKKLEDAERKLDEAKKEIDEIRNRKSKLEEARERFRKDKRELERLEKGF